MRKKVRDRERPITKTRGNEEEEKRKGIQIKKLRGHESRKSNSLIKGHKRGNEKQDITGEKKIIKKPTWHPKLPLGKNIKQRVNTEALCLSELLKTATLKH